MDQARIGVKRVFPPEILNNRRFGANEPGNEVSCVEFIQIGCVNSDRIGIDRRPLNAILVDILTGDLAALEVKLKTATQEEGENEGVGEKKNPHY